MRMCGYIETNGSGVDFFVLINTLLMCNFKITNKNKFAFELDTITLDNLSRSKISVTALKNNYLFYRCNIASNLKTTQAKQSKN